MALKLGESIGEEVHELDQFFRVGEGAGEVILDGVRTSIRTGFAILDQFRECLAEGDRERLDGKTTE
jgi:hypothetical protein